MKRLIKKYTHITMLLIVCFININYISFKTSALDLLIEINEK